MNQFTNIISLAEGGSLLKDSIDHGIPHYKVVALCAVNLCRDIPKADPLVALLFGMFHDSKRINEHNDPDHGKRAAEFILDYASGGMFDICRLTGTQLAKLVCACERHTDEQVTDDLTIAACFNADRFQLPRVGIELDWNYFSGIDGHIFNKHVHKWADMHRCPPSWEEILSEYYEVQNIYNIRLLTDDFVY